MEYKIELRGKKKRRNVGGRKRKNAQGKGKVRKGERKLTMRGKIMIISKKSRQPTLSIS